MYETQQHEMQSETRHSSGTEEWYCPTCGRRILLRVPPADEMIIVAPGDSYASHSGSTGGVRIGPVQAVQHVEETLQLWVRAFEDLDFD